MCIGSKLIRIVCVHTKCTLTTICIECTFNRSTSIGGLKVNCIIIGIDVGVIYLCVINCIRKRAIRKEITSVTLLLRLGKVFYL